VKKPGISQRVDYILDACRGKRVLHVGCADAPYTRRRLDDGTILHAMIEGIAAVQYGIDLNAEGIQMLREAGYTNLAVADVEDLVCNNPFGDIEFDVILAGEILEHLFNPGIFLDGIKPLLKKSSSRLVLTTINAYSAYRFVHALLSGYENVHPEHVCYFSQSTLKRLVTQHGYAIEDFSFYPVGREHEKTLKQGFSWILWYADRFAYKFNPVLADGVIMTCRVAKLESGNL
jgi:2-polyprenyl-3-methyl-5-hydroxy-6-metoxy-1,4-benzoquinol methylase